MKQCKICNNPVESQFATYCINCRTVKRKNDNKINKEKYKYHKQPRYIYKRYKSGALRRGHTFDITFEEFNKLWNIPCNYCKKPIAHIGIDRKDNSIGYVTSNIIPCCTTCNLMKGKLTHEEFITKCIEISKKWQ